MMKKYGRSYGDITSIKTNFTVDNDILLKENNRIRDLYSNQPKRTNGKVGGKDHKVFKSHGILKRKRGNLHQPLL